MTIYILLAKIFGREDFEVYGTYLDESKAIQDENYHLVGCESKIVIAELR